MNQKNLILDIAMNLNRVGNWAADGYQDRQKRIRLFLDQTNQYIESVEISSFPESLKETFERFKKNYKEMEEEEREGPKDPLFWAENIMTWGNILTHRSNLLK